MTVTGIDARAAPKNRRRSKSKRASVKNPRHQMRYSSLRKGFTDYDNFFNQLNPLQSGSPSGFGSQRRSPLSFNDNYEDFLFDDYGEDIVKSVSFTSNSGKYLQSNACGRKFMCRRGDRGPCHRNEVFVPQQNASHNAIISASSCSNFNAWNGCFPADKFPDFAGTEGESVMPTVPIGCCLLRFPERPCFGYPPSYRFFNKTKRCYPTSQMNEWRFSGPCTPNKIFFDADGTNGMCRCRERNHLLWKTDERCYRVFAKGPCSDGEWLEPEANGYGQCRPSPCPPSKTDGRHIYWKPVTYGEAGCYKSFTRGPCHRGSYFLIDNFTTKKARCISQYKSMYSYPTSMKGYSQWGPYSPFYTPYWNSKWHTRRQQKQWMNPWTSGFGQMSSHGMNNYFDYDDYDLWDF